MQYQLRLSATWAYALIAAWNILPDIEHEYRKTRYAFRCQGLDPLPFSPALLKPILIKTVMWSQTVAMTEPCKRGSVIAFAS